MPATRPISRRVLAGSTLGLVGGGFALRERPQQAPSAKPAGTAGRAAVAAPAEHAEATTPAARTVDRAELTAKLDAYRTKRGGTQGLFVRDLRSGGTFEWETFTNETLSTVKVLILISCLRKCEDSSVTFSDAQHKQARRMIQRSDNEATDALLAWVGTSHVQETARLLNLANTTVHGGGAAGTATWWGYSTTTPADWVTVLGSIAAAPSAQATTGKAIVHGGHRAYIRSLMAGVIPDQCWGVAAPPLPSSVYTETKNGWGSRSNGYHLNSIGRVVGNGRDYELAILTRSTRGFRYGRETINGLSSIVYKALSDQL